MKTLTAKVQPRMASLRFAFTLSLLVAGAPYCRAQTPAPAASSSTPATASSASTLQQQIDQLVQSLNATREELNQSAQKIQMLQRQMQQLQQKLAAQQPPASNGVPASTAPADAYGRLSSAVSRLKEQQQIDQSEIAQHAQSKVGTESKYPVELTGLLLFNGFVNDGAVDNLDLPIVALPRTATVAHGSTGATLRQSIVGVAATGPRLWGARSFADINIDFFGGLAPVDYQATNGVVRMRTAHAELSWNDTHAAFSLDRPLFSPRYPTSLMTVAAPALAWSGNLWAWNPQLTADHTFRFAGQQWLAMQAGVMDVPDPGHAADLTQRTPSAAEKSRYPGSELHLAVGHGAADASAQGYGEIDPVAAAGIGGYWSPHDPVPGVHTDAWAGTFDWNLPLGRHLAWSGALYRGASLGGLGGGVFKDYVLHRAMTSGGSGNVLWRPLNAAGGWAQAKFVASERWQMNIAGGEDNGYARDLHWMNLAATSNYSDLARNQTIFGNVVYTPSAYLLFSVEYRKIRSWPIYGAENAAQTFGLAMGYQF